MKNNASFIIGFVVFMVIIIGAVILIPNITNKQIWDTTFSFERAIVALPDGRVVDGEVASWKDFEDGDQIQVKFKTGETYLTHISNVVMISE